MAPKKSVRITEAAGVKPSAAAITEASINFLMSIPEISEAFSRADLDLALDDIGWEKFGLYNNTVELTPTKRRTIILESRAYWHADPLAKQAVRLWTDYCFGNGMTYDADDATRLKLEAFCNDRRNRHIMNVRGQQRNSKRLLIDGDVFFAIFTGNEGKKYVRLIDALQVVDILSDPDDDDHVMVYKRRTATDKTLFYLDWRLAAEEVAQAKQLKDPDTGKTIEKDVQADVVIYHLPFDNLGKRGNGLLSSCTNWSREHRRFMESRVALTQALAKFAFKMTAKGGQTALDKLKQRMQSSVAASGLTGGLEKNPVTAPGGTRLLNEGLEMEAMPRTTGAGDARNDSDSLKLMVSAGTGIMLHYFGDPSTGNLATATAMELPMLKMFQGYQQLWSDAYQDIFCIVLDEDPDAEAVEIDVDMPPILQEDLQKLGAYITQMTTAFPETKIPDVIEMLLTALGVDDIEDLMPKIEAQKKIVDAQTDLNNQVTLAKAKLTPAQLQQEADAQEHLAAAMLKLAEKL